MKPIFITILIVFFISCSKSKTKIEIIANAPKSVQIEFDKDILQFIKTELSRRYNDSLKLVHFGHAPIKKNPVEGMLSVYNDSSKKEFVIKCSFLISDAVLESNPYGLKIKDWSILKIKSH
jgi:hypothetical protein